MVRPKVQLGGTTSEVLWSTYHYSICKRGSMRLQNDGEIGVPEMTPSHVQLNLQYVAVYRQAYEFCQALELHWIRRSLINLVGAGAFVELT